MVVLVVIDFRYCYGVVYTPTYMKMLFEKCTFSIQLVLTKDRRLIM
jgi:hypothetical protein